jgi:methylmalonyl-CoA/ethylmalonyl-CoA epimerase
VVIAVHDLNDALKKYSDAFGLQVSSRMKVEEQNFEVALMPIGDFSLEFVQPLPEEAVVTKFLQSRGEGLYRLAFKTDDLPSIMRKLETSGVSIIAKTRAEMPDGTTGDVVVLHPRSLNGVMVAVYQLH